MFTDNTAYSQKPDDNGEYFLQLRCIFPNNTIDGNLGEKVKTNVEIEHSAHSNGAEEPDKESLLLLLNLPNLPVHGKDDRYTAKQEYENAQEDEPVYWYHVVVSKAGPGTYGTEP